jgi:hypothetical protein
LKTKEEFNKNYDFDSVYRDGWGLHKETSKFIVNLSDKIKNVVEFGSGGSTHLLLDIKKNLGYNFNIDSFDHNEKFSYQVKGDEENFKLNIRELVQFNQVDYNEMFSNKKISEQTNKVDDIFNTRLQNAFYNIKEGDLRNDYDLVILDGPNGNGRNIGYLHLINRLKSGAIIIIDDFDHYDFVEKCQYMFDVEILEQKKFDHPLKGHCILKIK